jgi:hypothetical protein
MAPSLALLLRPLLVLHNMLSARFATRFVGAVRRFNSGSRPALTPGHLTREAILALPSTPSSSPSYPRGPYTFYNREYFILAFESDPIAVRQRVPEPLVPAPGNVVLYEWIAMPDSTGFDWCCSCNLI